MPILICDFRFVIWWVLRAGTFALRWPRLVLNQESGKAGKLWRAALAGARLVLATDDADVLLRRRMCRGMLRAEA